MSLYKLQKNGRLMYFSFICLLSPYSHFIVHSLSRSHETSTTHHFVAFATNLIVENSKFKITGEENLKVYSDPKTLSGTPVERYFCGTCGK
jgi:hypothetical protein